MGSVKLFIILAILAIGNVQSFPQIKSPDMSGLAQMIRQTFEGYTPQNTRAYTIIGNGASQMFPLDKGASFPLPPSASGPVRTVITSNNSGYPPYSQQTVQSSAAQIPGWKPSDVNPYSYLLGNRYQQGRADFSHEVEEAAEEDQGTIITLDDIESQLDDTQQTGEIQIESSMSFSK